MRDIFEAKSEINEVFSRFILDCKRAGISVPAEMDIEDIASCPQCGRTVFPGREFCDAICESEWNKRVELRLEARRLLNGIRADIALEREEN